MTDKEKYDDALRRFKAARQRKRDAVAALEKELKAEYEQRTGQSCNYIFSI